jgi:ATP-dependent Clp protease ATP-binding subunit ClpA
LQQCSRANIAALSSEEHSQTMPGAAIYPGNPNQVFITPRFKRLIDVANEEANRLRDEYISADHLLPAMFGERNTTLARILEKRQLTRDGVYEAITALRDRRREGRSPEYIDAWVNISSELARAAIERNLDPQVGRQLIQLIIAISSPREE